MIMLLKNITYLRSGKMAQAPRYNKKATKVAFSILGVPGNLRFKRSKWQEYVNRQLLAQETSRVK